VIGRVRRAALLLLEAARSTRVPHDPRIAQALKELAAHSAGQRPADGIERYLRERPALARLELTQDWHRDTASGELRLRYQSSLVAPGCLRLVAAPPGRGTLVFLHGSLASADDALGGRERPGPVAELARDAGLGLACWDWPFQSERGSGGLYSGLRLHISGEREYARILPALGTSLWREFVAELRFALRQIRRQVGEGSPLHVVGSSMGGGFAYAAPLLGVEIASAAAIGSCARVADLLAEGATRTHGFFFYPLDGLRYFDLEDIVDRVLARGTRLLILHGDRDWGCRESTRRALRTHGVRTGRVPTIEVLPDHGHEFSDAIRARVLAFLREAEPR